MRLHCSGLFCRRNIKTQEFRLSLVYVRLSVTFAYFAPVYCLPSNTMGLGSCKVSMVMQHYGVFLNSLRSIIAARVVLTTVFLGVDFVCLLDAYRHLFFTRTRFLFKYIRLCVFHSMDTLSRLHFTTENTECGSKINIFSNKVACVLFASL